MLERQSVSKRRVDKLLISFASASKATQYTKSIENDESVQGFCARGMARHAFSTINKGAGVEA